MTRAHGAVGFEAKLAQYKTLIAPVSRDICSEPGPGYDGLRHDEVSRAKGYFGIVEVRGLARAHVAAGYRAGAKRRNIVIGPERGLFDLAKLLQGIRPVKAVSDSHSPFSACFDQFIVKGCMIWMVFAEVM